MSDITRAQRGKANRALKKCGNAAPTEAQKEEVVLFFLARNINPALKSSSFLTREFRLRVIPPVPLTAVPPPAAAAAAPAPTKPKTQNEATATRSKLTRALRKAGYPEPSE